VFSFPEVEMWRGFKGRRNRGSLKVYLAAGAAAGCLYFGASASAAVVAATWLPTGGGSWATPGNWDTNSVPDGAGASATFTDPGATRAVTVDSGATGFTVGSMTFNNGTPSATAINTGTAGSKLILDTGVAGSTVTITVNGTTAGAGNTTIAVPTTFNQDVIAVVNQTGQSSTAGALNWTGAVSGGSGGFTKQGQGLLTFGTGGKAYTGATVLDTNTGRTRISVAGSPTATSSFTVKSGAQITLITANGNYTWGTGPLNLNGTGLGASSPQGNFPGVIRNDTNLVATINNPIVLQSDSLIHVQGAATGSTTFSNTVSGPGGLTLTATNSNTDIGKLVLNGAGTFTGQTVVNAGTLQLGASSGPALGGTSGLVVHNLSSAGSTVGVVLLAAANQINDTAPVTLDGGNLNTAGLSEGSVGAGGKGVAGAGPLSVSANSIIDLGNGASTLAFANSAGAAWAGTLNVYNWTGNVNTGGGTDALFFGSDQSGLTSAQLAQLRFYSDAGTTLLGSGTTILSTGEAVPTVPEPATGMILSAVAIGWAARRARRTH
jgi:autotransporter-associated beta strand protein